MAVLVRPSRPSAAAGRTGRRSLPAALPGAARQAPAVLFWLLLAVTLVLPILLFLVVAVSPRLLDQGPQWFSLGSFGAVFQGQFLHGLLDSVAVGAAAAVTAAAIGFAVAWLLLRTDVPLRRLWTGSMFALLLAPSYLLALGVERLLEPNGVLDVLGWDPAGLRAVFYGPVGIVVVLAFKGVPFAYLALSNALRGLGEEFETAVRVHGGGPPAALRVVAALIAPAVWSALAIVFAESVSDFGVASTLADAAHFPVATFQLYNAVEAFPVQFPVAAAIGWVLLGVAGLALAAQSLALRGRSYRVLGGRSRPARRHRLRPAARIAAVAFLGLLVLVGLGVPAFGAVSASLISGLGSLIGSHGVTLSNFSRVVHDAGLRDSLLYSAKLATITATVATVVGLLTARLLADRDRARAARLVDMVLLSAVALPGIVFAAGYIFTYNLPLTNSLGIHLYETTTLLVVGYIATALPSTARVLTGSVGQVQRSLRDAARVHGLGAAGSWLRAVLPLLARPLVAAWSLTFAATVLELPISQLLYPPDQPPVSVGITRALSTYDYGGGTAMEVLAILFALAVIGFAWLVFRLLAPSGWRRLGSAS